MPNDKCEINWVPTNADEEFITGGQSYTASTANALSNLMTRVNFAVILVKYTGAADTTIPVTFNQVSIVEFSPEIQTTVLDAAHVGPSIPGVRVTDIVRIIQSRDPKWYIDAFKKVAKLTGRVAGAYASGGILGLVGEVASMAIAPKRNVSS
jgi:hypothetical protein